MFGPGVDDPVGHSHVCVPRGAQPGDMNMLARVHV